MTTPEHDPVRAGLLGLAKDVWWAVLLRGIAAIVFGILAMVWPGVTLLALVFVFGAYAVVDGVVDAVRAIQARHEVDTWVWWLLGGIASVVAGILAFAWPGITAVAAAILIGAWALVTGVFEVIGAFRLRRMGVGHWGWLVASGLLSIVFGLVLMVFPGDGIVSLVWVLGVWAVVFGVFLVIAALQVRKAVGAITGRT